MKNRNLKQALKRRAVVFFNSGPRVAMLFALTLVLLHYQLAGNVDAAAVYVNDSEVPIVGFIKAQTATHITILVPEGNTSIERLIPMAQVIDVVETVDATRLATLNPSVISGYRDYAEELMVKRIDPEARETAIRLFLITAKFAETGLRASSLRGLISLARSADEQRLFHALAWRYGAIGSMNDVIANAAVDAASGGKIGLDSAQRQALRDLIRYAREGAGSRIRRMIARDDFKSMFVEHDLSMTYDEFVSLLKSSSPTSAQLANLVRLELLLLSGNVVRPSVSTQKWGDLVSSGKSQAVRTVTIDSVTEFDPNECYFKDGTWTKKP